MKRENVCQIKSTRLKRAGGMNLFVKASCVHIYVCIVQSVRCVCHALSKYGKTTLSLCIKCAVAAWYKQQVHTGLCTWMQQPLWICKCTHWMNFINDYHDYTFTLCGSTLGAFEQTNRQHQKTLTALITSQKTEFIGIVHVQNVCALNRRKRNVAGIQSTWNFSKCKQ